MPAGTNEEKPRKKQITKGLRDSSGELPLQVETGGKINEGKGDEIRKSASKIEAAIENSVDDFDRTTTQIAEEIGKKEVALRKEFDEANVSISRLKADLDKNATDLRTGIAGSLGWVIGRIENLEVASYAVAVVFAIAYIAAIAYYAIPWSFETLSPLGVSLALAVLVGYSARRAKQGLTGGSETITQYIMNTFAAIGSLAGKRLRLHESFDGVDQGLRTALSTTKRILTSTKAFNPALKAVYEQATTEFKQGNFVRALANALRSYGIRLDSDSEKLLTAFTSLTNTEDEWLAELSKPLAKKLGVSPSLVSLFYYAYVDHAEGTKNTWHKIKSDSDEMASLVRMLLNNSQNNYLDNSNPKAIEFGANLIKRWDNFEPWKFYRALNNFQVELRTFEESVIQALIHFGFNIGSPQQRILYEFVPNSVDPDGWKDEFIGIVSNQFSVSDIIVLLFLNESSGDNAGAQKTLAKIKRDPEKLGELLTLLTANKVLKIPERYATSIDRAHAIISEQISGKNFTSIDTIATGLDTYFTSLEGGKQRLLQALTSYNVKITETLRQQFERNYLPSEVDLQGMIGYFSEHLGVRKEFISIFYFESIQDDSSLLTAYSIVLSNGWTKELADLLIKLGFLEIPADSNVDVESSNLSSILKSFKTFKLSSIQSRYQSFRSLLVWSTNLYNYCAEQGISPKDFLPDFPSLLSLLKGDTSMRSYEQLSRVCEKIVSRSELGSSGESVAHAAVLSILVLFFNSNDDSRKGEACRELASNDLASRIVYQFISLSEAASLNRSKVVLQDVIREVLTNDKVQYPYLEDVRSVISEGRVPSSISDVATVRFGRQLKSIDDLEKRTTDVTKMFDEMKTSLRTFFEAEFDKDVVFQLLKLQVVSAYLVTTSARKPVIGDIIDRLMPEICEDYARRDSKFKNLLMIETGAGNYTRIGIVPIGKSFEQFSEKFMEIFHAAVERHCDEHPGERPSEFSANVIRIFPMDATFKIVVGDLTVEPSEHPALHIRDLFLSRFSNEENLALAAAARVNDPERLAVRKVIIDLFDGYTSLWSLLASKISPLIGARRQLREAFENKTFDRQFLKLFESRTMTELTAKIYAVASTPKGKKETKEKVFTHVSEMLKTLDSRMSESERETLTNDILERLYNIGLILSSQ